MEFEQRGVKKKEKEIEENSTTEEEKVSEDKDEKDAKFATMPRTKQAVESESDSEHESQNQRHLSQAAKRKALLLRQRLVVQVRTVLPEVDVSSDSNPLTT